MQEQENIYRSILFKISTMPIDYLQQVDSYLKDLIIEIEAEKEANRKRILSLAGAWSDMEDKDFDSYLDSAKQTSIIEDRNIDL